MSNPLPGRDGTNPAVTSPAGGGAVRLEALEKDYDGTPAVRGIDVDIRAGEFFSLLGPSGCGKTSTLRMIAGFERPSAGRVLLDGEDLSATPAHKRPVNTVFQDYALFPFMDVRSNVAFGLRYQDVDKSTAAAKVDEALALVRMSQYAKRRPAQMSGGQRQRVALARALVLGPRVLLLDEPLGALDAKLRKDLQIELKSLQERLGITFIYVTHDQEEALTMSDRLAVMAEGRVEQVGTPRDVYETPATAYVADFLGAANVLQVERESADASGVAVRLGDQVLRVPDGPPDPAADRLVVRPERLRLVDPVPAPDVLVGELDRQLYLGATTDVVVRLTDGRRLVVARDSAGGRDLVAGAAVGVHLPAGSMRLLPPGALT